MRGVELFVIYFNGMSDFTLYMHEKRNSRKKNIQITAPSPNYYHPLKPNPKPTQHIASSWSKLKHVHTFRRHLIKTQTKLT